MIGIGVFGDNYEKEAAWHLVDIHMKPSLLVPAEKPGFDSFKLSAVAAKAAIARRKSGNGERLFNKQLQPKVPSNVTDNKRLKS